LLQEFPDLGEARENLHAKVLAVPKTRYLIILYFFLDITFVIA